MNATLGTSTALAIVCTVPATAHASALKNSNLPPNSLSQGISVLSRRGFRRDQISRRLVAFPSQRALRPPQLTTYSKACYTEFSYVHTYTSCYSLLSAPPPVIHSGSRQPASLGRSNPAILQRNYGRSLKIAEHQATANVSLREFSGLARTQLAFHLTPGLPGPQHHRSSVLKRSSLYTPRLA